MTTKYITSDLWNEVEQGKTKIAKKVYQVMNEDNFSVILDRDVFWFEKTWSGARMPEYCYKYAIKFYKKFGYKYLYEFSKGFTN
jgi:hypothetical protein